MFVTCLSYRTSLLAVVEFRSQSEDLFRTQLKIRKMDDDSKHMAPNMQRGLSKHRKSDVMNN